MEMAQGVFSWAEEDYGGLDEETSMAELPQECEWGQKRASRIGFREGFEITTN